jgi:hypothetical protein
MPWRPVFVGVFSPQHQRTRDALQAAKRRGTKLGNPRRAAARRSAIKRTRAKAQEFAHALGPIITEIQGAGVRTLKGIARCLNARDLRRHWVERLRGRL